MATEAITQWHQPVRHEPTFWSRRRGSRVGLLTAAIAILSVADLIITMTYLQSTGMFEGNPVARWVISHGSSTLLVVWKLGSVVLACAVFAKFRKRWSTEIACWACFVVLSWLLVQWKAYAEESDRLLSTIQRVEQVVEPYQFVRMED